MMKKKFLVGFIFIALISFAVGQLVGTVITQSTFDNTDFSVRDLEITLESVQKTDTDMVINISFLNLTKRTDGDWEIVTETASFTFKLEDYHICRTSGSIESECIRQAQDDILSQSARFKSVIKEHLTADKTKVFENEFTVEDITLTSEQLNNA